MENENKSELDREADNLRRLLSIYGVKLTRKQLMDAVSVARGQKEIQDTVQKGPQLQTLAVDSESYLKAAGQAASELLLKASIGDLAKTNIVTALRHSQHAMAEAALSKYIEGENLMLVLAKPWKFSQDDERDSWEVDLRLVAASDEAKGHDLNCEFQCWFLHGSNLIAGGRAIRNQQSVRHLIYSYVDYLAVEEIEKINQQSDYKREHDQCPSSTSLP